MLALLLIKRKIMTYL